MKGRTLTRADLAEAVYQEVGLSRSEFRRVGRFDPDRDRRFAARRRGRQDLLLRHLLGPPQGPPDRPQSEDRRGGPDHAAQGAGVPALAIAEGSHQRRQRRCARARRTIDGRFGRRRRPTAPLRQRAGARPPKSAAAFRTISEVATELDVAQHVLRFWESKFPQVRPLKRGGGRRYYRPEDIDLLRQIRSLLYDEGYTIKGAQKLLKGHKRPPATTRSTSRRPAERRARAPAARAAARRAGDAPPPGRPAPPLAPEVRDPSPAPARGAGGAAHGAERDCRRLTALSWRAAADYNKGATDRSERSAAW